MTKIQYNIQVITREVVDGIPEHYYHNRMYQVATINENMSFDHQVEIAKDLLEKVMRNLRKEHEKNQD